MTTLVSLSAGSYLKSLHGKSVAGVYDIYTKDLYRYQLLYDIVVAQMKEYTDYLNTRERTTFSTEFTTAVYNNLLLTADEANFQTENIEKLDGFEYEPGKFNLMRSRTYDFIGVLNESRALIEEKKILESDVETLTKEFKEVLEDPIKLNNYIINNQIDRLPFQASQTFNIEIKLQPWYEKYFDLWGPPPNGAFDSEKLALIVIELINNKVITEDEFINS